jgi:alkanesulfonate monooxygenase
LPGQREDSAYRYKRCAETIEILKQAWTKDSIDFSGEVYKVKLPNTQPVKPYQQNGGPLLYFGGTSPGSREICAEYCDVFLMWPEDEESMYDTMQDMSQRAKEKGRQIDFGLRIHVIVRETEAEARAYAKKLVSKFNEQKAAEIRSRGEDSRSLGVQRQDKLREELADEDGYIENLLWMEIGKVFSGCGGGLVGSAEQVIAKLNRYVDMGIRAFILSGFPLIEEGNHFAELVLPHFKNVSLSALQQRIPATTPVTPLTTAILQ